MLYALIWARGFVIVFLTACNVVQISRGHYAGAFVIGGAISYVWWGNSHSAALRNDSSARVAYAFGAACGTVVGMYVGGLWKG